MSLQISFTIFFWSWVVLELFFYIVCVSAKPCNWTFLNHYIVCRSSCSSFVVLDHSSIVVLVAAVLHLANVRDGFRLRCVWLCRDSEPQHASVESLRHWLMPCIPMWTAVSIDTFFFVPTTIPKLERKRKKVCASGSQRWTHRFVILCADLWCLSIHLSIARCPLTKTAFSAILTTLWTHDHHQCGSYRRRICW